VWLGAAGAESPDAARALDAWARAHDLGLAAPAVFEAKRVAVDPSMADAVEQDLAKAGDALVALDRAAAERALGDAEAVLVAHPELPQAAWLLAEVLRAWAARFTRIDPKDAGRAATAWGEASGLDGGRLAGVVEKSPEARIATVTATVSLANGDGAASLWLDGERVDPGALARTAGRHQLVATRDGVTASAAWVTFAEGAAIAADGGGPPPCSRGDLARAELAPAHDAVSAARVTCPSWVAAVPTRDPREIRVARCRASRCDPLLEWRFEALPSWVAHPPGPTAAPEHHGFAWPGWATWTALGVGACAIGAAVLAASGAFAARPIETHFVSGGVKTQGMAFSF
jgi:hypothetical protein